MADVHALDAETARMVEEVDERTDNRRSLTAFERGTSAARRVHLTSLGAVAQLGERLAGSQKVRGSSPLGSISRFARSAFRSLFGWLRGSRRASHCSRPISRFARSAFRSLFWVVAGLAVGVSLLSPNTLGSATVDLCGQRRRPVYAAFRRPSPS